MLRRTAPPHAPDAPTGGFFALTPDAVLGAVESLGVETTGLCYALNSLENRVYEVERVDGSRIVAKFYRPGRWPQEALLAEHALLLALAAAEVPVCAPLPLPSGATLSAVAGGIYVALFARTGGRSPDELNEAEYEQLGRLLARIHNVAAAMDLSARPVLSAATYGRDCLRTLESCQALPPTTAAAYADAVCRLVDLVEPLQADVETFVIHADCHRGNLLRGRTGFFFLDFDDMAHGPAVQDMWLLLPGRAADCPREVDALLRGYGQFRAFDRRSLALIEGLRGLRYVRYAAWIASRWHDPAFQRAFPGWGEEAYWQRQTTDLYDQLRLLLAA